MVISNVYPVDHLCSLLYMNRKELFSLIKRSRVKSFEFDGEKYLSKNDSLKLFRFRISDYEKNYREFPNLNKEIILKHLRQNLELISDASNEETLEERVKYPWKVNLRQSIRYSIVKGSKIIEEGSCTASGLRYGYWLTIPELVKLRGVNERYVKFALSAKAQKYHNYPKIERVKVGASKRMLIRVDKNLMMCLADVRRICNAYDRDIREKRREKRAKHKDIVERKVKVSGEVKNKPGRKPKNPLENIDKIPFSSVSKELSKEYSSIMKFINSKPVIVFFDEAGLKENEFDMKEKDAYITQTGYEKLKKYIERLSKRKNFDDDFLGSSNRREHIRVVKIPPGLEEILRK